MLEQVKIFLYSLFSPQPHYTFLNTFVYAIGFVFASYFFFLFLKRMKIKIDRNLSISLIPFVLLGSCLRVFVDAKILESIFLRTPLIYLTIGFLFVSVLLFSIFLQKKYRIPYFKLTYRIGILLSAPMIAIILIKIVNPLSSFLVLIFLSPWLILLKILKWKGENKAVFLTQIFDATVSFVGMNFFGYEEMHVLPKIFIESFGPISFVFLKALVVFSILTLIEKLKGEKEIKNFIKLMIGILGASTGIRDLFRILLLV
ncbi:MAG: DUF63 family protein [Candidatus Aenigmatarchaeota archaeon]